MYFVQGLCLRVQSFFVLQRSGHLLRVIGGHLLRVSGIKNN